MSENTHIMKNDKLTTVYKKLLMNIDNNITELEILMDWHIVPKSESGFPRYVPKMTFHGKLERVKDKDLWFDPIRVKCNKCNAIRLYNLNDQIRKNRRMAFKKHNIQHYHDYRMSVEKQFRQIIMLQHELKRSLELLWKSK